MTDAKLTAMVESCRAGNQPIRLDDETSHYERRDARNARDLDKAAPYILLGFVLSLFVLMAYFTYEAFK